MAKEKKIGIKHYLNTKLKPTLKDGEDLYPLYVRITYNGEVTRIKAQDFFGTPILLKGDLNDSDLLFLINHQTNRYRKTYLDKNLLERIIRLEIKINKSNFTLSGLGDRLKYYDNTLFSKTEFDALTELEDYLGDYLTYNQFIFMNINYESPLDVYLYAKEKIQGLNQILPTIIKQTLITFILIYAFDETLNLYDWIMKGKKEEFLKFMLSFDKNKLDKKSQKVLTELNFNFSDKEQYLSIMTKKINNLFKIR